jgi:3-hydroxyisobutyrate dehydrogenase
VLLPLDVRSAAGSSLAVQSGHEVGLIGVGILGRAVAETLLASGTPLTVHDIRPDAVAGLEGLGASVVQSVADVALASDRVLILVQTDDQCIDVARELFPALKDGSIVAVQSTISPETARELGAAAASHGVSLIEAALAGNGAEGVREGTILVLAGGATAAIDAFRPIFAAFSSNVVVAGDLGAASVLKLAHNLLVYLNYVAVVEAVELARAAGVRDGLVAEITERTGTLSPQERVFHDIYERRRLHAGDEAERAEFETYAALFEKDLRLALRLAVEHGLQLSGARAALGQGDQMYSGGRRGR